VVWLLEELLDSLELDELLALDEDELLDELDMGVATHLQVSQSKLCVYPGVMSSPQSA
jgi:hypothetical protein